MTDNFISFSTYQENTYKKWRHSILIISFVLSTFVLGIEVFMYYVLKTDPSRTDVNRSYIILRIIVPSVMNFGSFFTALLVQYSKKISMQTKNYFSTFPSFMLCSVLAIFHNFFQVLLISHAFCFFLCSLFGDTKILKINAFCTIPAFIIAAVTFWLDPETGEIYYRFLTIITATAIILSAFVFANTILTSQAEKIKYINHNYERQTALIEELRIDPLTKLYNRTALQETLVSIISRSDSEEIPPSLAIMDLDFFKSVNDQYGHINGDAVLITISDIIRKRMVSSRKAFRFGGEEFVLLFENTSAEQVSYILESIRKDFASTKFNFAPDKSFTLSAGISKIQNDDSPSIWIERADKALYYAKTHGRNQIKIFEE